MVGSESMGERQVRVFASINISSQECRGGVDGWSLHDDAGRVGEIPCSHGGAHEQSSYPLSGNILIIRCRDSLIETL